MAETHVAVVPSASGTPTEYFGEIRTNYGKGDSDYSRKELARKAVAESKLTSPYGVFQAVTVTLFKLNIVKGKIERIHDGGITVEVPQRPISQAEYNKEMEMILSVLPTAFRGFVSQYSWEQGHSAGYEEVISIARDLTDSLLKPIQSYKNALLY